MWLLGPRPTRSRTYAQLLDAGTRGTTFDVTPAGHVPTRLQRLLATLDAQDAEAASTTTRDPWHLILLENVVYLAADDARARAFATLLEQTDLDPATLVDCPDEVLLAACGEGRMASAQALKLRRCGALFLEFGAPRELVGLPTAQARKALKRFPGISDPGADKLLMFAGTQPVLALDSNGLRALLRLGYGQEAKSYFTSYKSAQRAAMTELQSDTDAFVRGYMSLRVLGKQTCRNTKPACAACPLRDDCPTGGDHPQQ